MEWTVAGGVDNTDVGDRLRIEKLLLLGKTASYGGGLKQFYSYGNVRNGHILQSVNRSKLYDGEKYVRLRQFKDCRADLYCSHKCTSVWDQDL